MYNPSEPRNPLGKRTATILMAALTTILLALVPMPSIRPKLMANSMRQMPGS